MSVKRARERIAELREYEEHSPAYIQERAWNRGIERVLAILDEELESNANFCIASKHHRVRNERTAPLVVFEENGVVYGDKGPISDTCVACGYDFAAEHA